ncbi:hypothetical protein [Pedobacter sp. SYSU D00535]|uniref:hypothetical protein n=1 Tax=Pedobacter sp. SYSU D00535 TaxID=2810308 RepID=UPI001A95E495|nr:hypothetical protein [Pedobacter sp. SYSU D00535]
MPISQVKSNIEIINDLNKSGALKSLVSSGLFPAKVLLHMEIYFYVTAKVDAGERKTEAVRKAAIDFDLDESSIYRILKSFSSKFLFIYG